MAVKISGVEFKRFYSDEKYWPDGAYHEDVEFLVNGEPFADEKDPGDCLDTDIVSIDGGIVLDSPLCKVGSEPTIDTYFRRWKKEQTSTSFVVECDFSKINEVQAAIKSAGGRVLK